MDERLAQPSLITAIALAAEGGLVALALLIASWWGHDPWVNLEWSRSALGTNLVAALWGLVAALPMIGGLLIIDRWPPRVLAPLKESVEREVVPLFAHAGVTEFALISLAAGLGEELFFRGLLQHGLAQELPAAWGLPVALAVSSVTFGVCHWLNREYALIATLIGVYLGVLLIVTDHLLAPIVAHAVYDFVALWYLVVWKRARAAQVAR